LKSCVLSTAAFTFIGTAFALWLQPGLFSAPLFVCLLPAATFISVLGQPLHRDNRFAWLLSLVMLGTSLGSLIAPEPTSHLSRIMLLGLVAFLIYRYRGPDAATAFRGWTCYGIGLIAAAAALLPTASAATLSLVVCATLLPLFPLHGGHVAVVTLLPGNLPALLTVLLPIVGWRDVPALLPTLEPTVRQTVELLALAGALYGSLRALTQIRPLPLFSYASLSFLSILWWALAVTGTAGQGGLFLGSVCLATSGLLLAWYAIRARYGDVDLQALGGMTYTMPRFSTLLCLLALAALGFPPFGVYAGLLGMLFDPAFRVSGGLAVVLFAWLAASWYLLWLMQQLVFKRRPSTLSYEDLHRPEFASLLILLALLTMLGVVPGRFVGADPVPASPNVVLQGAAWNR
jgi:NADH-quinone oxidoreductase subunit M